MKFFAKLREKKGQVAFIEYGVVVMAVSVAMFSMSTYAYRAVQATQGNIDQVIENN